MNRFPSTIVLVSLLLAAGCGPSAEERANLTVQSLTEQAQSFLESGLIDEAEMCLKKAIATPGATDTEAAEALVSEVKRTKYQRAWKKAEKELTPSFNEAVAKLESGAQDEAVAIVEKTIGDANGPKADCARQFLGRLRAVLDSNRAQAFWSAFDVAQLEKFRETDAFPETTWLDTWGALPKRPALLAAWRKTLRASLPEVVRRKKEEAAHAVPQSPEGNLDTNLTVPMEEVSGNPSKYFGKRVYFNGAWIRGGIKRDATHGYTVSVISPNNRRFPAKANGETMLFIVPPKLAKDINALVGPDSKIEVKIYVKVERGSIAALEGPKVFARAAVYWVGIVSDGKVQKVL